MEDSLEEVDATDITDDDEKLQTLYKDKTGYSDSAVEGWKSGRPPTIRGPYEHITALVIKLHSERLLRQSECVDFSNPP